MVSAPPVNRTNGLADLTASPGLSTAVRITAEASRTSFRSLAAARLSMYMESSRMPTWVTRWSPRRSRTSSSPGRRRMW